MQNANDCDRSVQALLATIGGGALIGSGFESEVPQPEYGSDQEEQHNVDRDHRNHAGGHLGADANWSNGSIT